MQSKSSQMTPETKEANRSPPAIDTGNSMARAPTQEPASDARVQPSTSSRERIHQRNESRGQYASRGRREPLVPAVNRLIRSITGEEDITQEISRETRKADIQNATSSHQMNRDIRNTHSGRRDDSGHPRRHGQTHDERGDASVPDPQDGTSSQQMNRDTRNTHSGRRDDSGHPRRHGQTHDERGDASVPDIQNGTSSQQMNRDIRNTYSGRRDDSGHPRRHGQTHDERGDAIVPNIQDGTSSQQMNLNIHNTHAGRRDDPGHHRRHGQTNDEWGDDSVRECVDDGGANEGEGGEGKVKEAEGYELSPNQGQCISIPVHVPHHRRGSARVPGRPSHHGRTHDERGDPNVRAGVDDRGANEGEREVKDTEGNELPTNQDLRPSNPVRMPYRRRESARDVIIRLEGTLRRRENDVYVLSTRNEELSGEIKTLKEELAHLQLERDQTRQLLHERTVELSSAQVFLGKADTISVTDVSRMVDILNAEISQASNSISDSLLDHQEEPATPDTTELNRLLHKVRSSIGARLCDILARRLCQPSAEFDPMITQLVLQAGLSEACYRIINDWNPPLWDTSSTLTCIYANMRPTGEYLDTSEIGLFLTSHLVGQVIAGRWRSLTRTYTNGQTSQDSEDETQVQDAKKNEIQEANADHLRSTLRDLLTIVGWSSKGPRHDLPSEYKEKMRFLSDEALKLHETIGRGITSKDLIVEIIPCETPFDPTKMDDADRQRGKPDAIPDDTVACTVELGLRYKCAKSGEDSEETGVILKPKVLLASVLVEEDREVTPPEPQN